jgi:hypothetical protein
MARWLDEQLAGMQPPCGDASLVILRRDYVLCNSTVGQSRSQVNQRWIARAAGTPRLDLRVAKSGAKPQGRSGPGCFPPLQNSPRHSRASMGNGSEDKARKLRHLWEELFPAEQARTMELLVRLPTRDRGCGSGLRGLVSLVAELRQDA